MYLGDGANIVEATFDDLYSPGSVRITSLDRYCTGSHALTIPKVKICCFPSGRLEPLYTSAYSFEGAL